MITIKINPQKKYSLGFVGLLTITTLSILSLYYFKPDNLSPKLYDCYYVIVFQLIIYLFIWCYLFLKKQIDVLEPIVLITAIHLLLFIITPIISLYSNEILWFDKNLWGGCIKGTWLSTLGYFLLVMGYYSTKQGRKAVTKRRVINFNKICKLSLIIWFFCFACNIVYLLSEGKNILYILTLGGNGTVDTEKLNTSAFSFLGVVSYGMLSAYLYIYQYSNSKLLKLILFYLMISSFLIRGFRFIIVAVIIAPLIFCYLKKGTRPNIISILVLLIFLAGLVGVIEGARDGLRAGNGMGDSITSFLSFEYIKDVLIENFSIYKTYYGIVQNFPLNMDYTYGQLMILYTLVMFIPRGIWPAKPYPISQEVNAVAVSEYASRAGTAYPYLGEYYHEFGIIGICFFSFLLGKICGKLKKNMYYKDIHSLVLYSAICPLLFQIMIRGYTPSNFYMIVFSILPIIILKKYSIYESKENLK